MLNNIPKHIITKALKTLVLSAFVVFLWHEIVMRDDAPELWANFSNNLHTAPVHYLFLAVILMPLNWALEAYKWWAFVVVFDKISFRKALAAVLAGVAVGVFTPSRIGEYGGRALLLERAHVVESVVATLLGSFSQFLATLCFGYVGIIYFLFHFMALSSFILWILVVLGIFSFLLTLFLFYHIDLVLDILKRFYQKTIFQQERFARIHRLVNGWLKHVKVLRNYSAKQLNLALFTAFLRYIVYTLQYYFMLRFMGIEVGLMSGVACIAMVFLLQTSIPLPPVTGLVARGGTALYVWRFFTNNEIAILTTTFSLWLLNVIIPAAIGMIILMRKKVE